MSTPSLFAASVVDLRNDIGELSGQLGNLSTQLAATKTDLTNTRAELAQTRAEIPAVLCKEVRRVARLGATALIGTVGVLVGLNQLGVIAFVGGLLGLGR